MPNKYNIKFSIRLKIMIGFMLIGLVSSVLVGIFSYGVVSALRHSRVIDPAQNFTHSLREHQKYEVTQYVSGHTCSCSVKVTSFEK